MPEPIISFLNDPAVGAALARAWLDSHPGVTGGHEEGGFILRDESGNLEVVRWPVGQLNTIQVPSHPGCRIGDWEIVATFHTHPNTGSDFLQEPSETDKRAVRDDPDLKGSAYLGEIVIAQQQVYLVTPAGQASMIDSNREFPHQD
jgi:hypothetical protein